MIGLEVHIQLKTQSKIFCACSTAFGDPPNTNVCPVCLGLPGALPVLNAHAVELGVRAALALDFTVHGVSIFARKNYFYPDLPKGYQISQFEAPLATAGTLEVPTAGGGTVRIGITRLHLEEDAGKSVHDRVPSMTAVDLNRSGTPLAEIVSEPDLRSPEQARAYLVVLKQILEYLDVSDCNMEEGSLRVDANVSVRQVGDSRLGTKQEVKNMNSFAGLERAVGQLRDQQIALLEAGVSVELATYSAATGELRHMRSKEESHDYRYFPEPDLPPLDLARYGIDIAKEREGLPELPARKRNRFADQHGLSGYDAEVLASTQKLGNYFEEVASGAADPRAAAKWVMGPVLAAAKDRGGSLSVAPGRVVQLIRLVGEAVLSEQAAKRVFVEIVTNDADPETVAKQLGLVQVGDDDVIAKWVDEVLRGQEEAIARYRGGEKKVLGFFMGAVMKASGGRADPKRVQSALRRRLDAG